MSDNLSIEETKTMIGKIMVNIRQNWGGNLKPRLAIISELLITLIKNDAKNKNIYEKDLGTIDYLLIEPSEGSILRDECTLYGYSSTNGDTPKINEYLKMVLVK
jgi:hypothetical protein